MILEQGKGVHCVDLDESFPTCPFSLNLFSNRSEFQRVFTCKIWLRYSRERALKGSKVLALGNLNLNFKILNLLFAAQATQSHFKDPIFERVIVVDFAGWVIARTDVRKLARTLDSGL